VSAAAPQLSVLIATHDRRDLLRRCLAALERQSLDPSEFEVIVADDGSTDGSAAMVEELDSSLRIRVVELEKLGRSGALNAALDVAVADVCVFLDDDVIASPGLVAAYLEAHRKKPMTLGIGALTQRPPDARDWYAHAFARAWNHHYAELAERDAHWTDCYGGNVSAPRKELIALGGFSTELTAAEDFDIGFRLCRRGCTATFLPKAHGIHDDQKRRPRMISDARALGPAYVELSRLFPEIEPYLLRWTRTTGPRELSLRRLLIALRLPPELLGRLGRLVPGEGRKAIWLKIVGRLAVWQGVRESVSRQEWKRLVDKPPASSDPKPEPR
jgi:glycosyltransferase involved in cell wall biosynthesis